MTTGPLFILGAPGSGTSLLYRALCLHPRAAWISNYNRRLAALPQVAMLNRLGHGALDVRRQAWFGEDGENVQHSGQRRALRERAVPRPVEGEPLFRRRRVLADLDDGIPDAEQLMLRTDLARLTRAAGGGVLVSKRLGHNRRIALLAEIFPDSKFLVMSRDGRAVARSLLAADWWPRAHIWWWGGTPADWAKDGGDPTELAAEHWVHEVQAIDEGLTGLSSRRVLRVSVRVAAALTARRTHRDGSVRWPRGGPGLAGGAGPDPVPGPAPARRPGQGRPADRRDPGRHLAVTRLPGLTAPRQSATLKIRLGPPPSGRKSYAANRPFPDKRSPS